MGENATTEVLPVTVKDFYQLLQKAQNELKLRDEDINSLESVKQIKEDGVKWSHRHAGILYAGLAFLLLFGLPSSLYMSIKKETSFGQFVVSRYGNNTWACVQVIWFQAKCSRILLTREFGNMCVYIHG